MVQHEKFILECQQFFRNSLELLWHGTTGGYVIDAAQASGPAYIDD